MSILFHDPRFRPISSSGNVYPGAKLYAYETGTSNLQNTYSDAALSVANTNPVVADSGGLFGSIYLGESLPKYKFILKDASDVTIWSVDPYNPKLSLDAIDVSQAAFGAILYPRTAAEIAAGVTPTNYYYGPGNVLRYGTNTTPGTTDMASAIQAALSIAMIGGGFVYIPSGRYKVATGLLAIWANHGVTIYGDGYDTTDGGSQLEYSGSAGGSLLTLVGFSGIHPIKIRGCAFVNVSGNDAFGIRLRSWRNADICSNYFEGFKHTTNLSAAIWFDAKAGYTTVNDVSEFNYVVDNFFNDNRHNVYATLAGVNNIFIVRNRMLAHTRAAIYYQWVNDGALGETYLHHWVIRDNWFYGDTNTADPDIIFESAAKGVLIDGNYFEYNVSGSTRPLIRFLQSHVPHSGIRVTNGWLAGYPSNPGGVIEIGNCDGLVVKGNEWARLYGGSAPANAALVAFLDASVTSYEIDYPALPSGAALTNTLRTSGGTNYTAKRVDSNEGTWTPVIKFGGASVGVTYSVQLGKWRRDGNRVTAQFRLVLTSKGSSTGIMTIDGLPYAQSSSAASYGASGNFASYVGFSGITGALALAGNPSQTQLNITMGGASAVGYLNNTNATNSAEINGSVVFFVD